MIIGRKEEFKEFREDDLIDIFDIMHTPPELSRFELDKKLIKVNTDAIADIALIKFYNTSAS